MIAFIKMQKNLEDMKAKLICPEIGTNVSVEDIPVVVAASCSATAIIDTNPPHREFEMVKSARLSNHNHVCNSGRIVNWKIRAFQEIFFAKFLTLGTSSITLSASLSSTIIHNAS